MFFRNYRNAQLEFSRSVSPDTMYVPWQLTSRTRWLKSKLNCTVYYEARTFYLKDIKRRHFWLSYMMDYITFVLAWGDEIETGFASHIKMLLVIMEQNWLNFYLSLYQNYSSVSYKDQILQEINLIY